MSSLRGSPFCSIACAAVSTLRTGTGQETNVKAVYKEESNGQAITDVRDYTHCAAFELKYYYLLCHRTVLQCLYSSNRPRWYICCMFTLKVQRVSCCVFLQGFVDRCRFCASRPFIKQIDMVGILAGCGFVWFTVAPAVYLHIIPGGCLTCETHSISAHITYNPSHSRRSDTES